MKSYSRNGLTFRVLDSGRSSAEPVVALHGFPQNSGAWLSVAADLVSSGFRVIAPDQRGYSPGARPRRRRDYVISELVKDVEALLLAGQFDRVHLVGHDWGGLVAWSLASRFPEKIATLTVVATPHPRAFVETFLFGKQLLSSWYMIFFQIPWLPEAVLRSRNGEVLRAFLVKSGLDESIARRYSEAFGKDTGLLTSAINWYRALPLDLSLGFKTGRVTVPTLYVVGECDSFVSRRAALRTDKWVSGSYLRKDLDSATHWIPEQNSSQLADAVKAFISSHART
ncbi:alpha/beta fold hydrolase [Amycolatopsis sp. NPDC101161]|uniref:alpha/beta fold hydrolase n=1 Tax=Amycolatopsis sp. NPDC101161 TaxID=3363940 RepID=UPI00381836FE